MKEQKDVLQRICNRDCYHVENALDQSSTSIAAAMSLNKRRNDACNIHTGKRIDSSQSLKKRRPCELAMRWAEAVAVSGLCVPQDYGRSQVPVSRLPGARPLPLFCGGHRPFLRQGQHNIVGYEMPHEITKEVKG